MSDDIEAIRARWDIRGRWTAKDWRPRSMDKTHVRHLGCCMIVMGVGLGIIVGAACAWSGISPPAVTAIGVIVWLLGRLVAGVVRRRA